MLENERIEASIDEKYKGQVMIFTKSLETLLRRTKDYEVLYI